MASYLYKTTVFTDTSNVNGIDVTQNNIDKTDYETNNKSSVVEVSDVVISETTFVIEDDYTTFDALIDGTIIKWDDVQVCTKDDRYVMNLFSGSAL